MAKEKKEDLRLLYLSIVYIAMVGLWVMSTSDSVLDSFHKFRINIDQARESESLNLKNLFLSFESSKLKEEPARAMPLYKRAKTIDSVMNSLENEVKTVREALENGSGGINPETGDLINKGDLDASPRIMISNGMARALKEKLIAGQTTIQSMLSPTERKKTPIDLTPETYNKKGGIVKSWEQSNFGDGLPVTASVTTLATIQSDIVNVKAKAIKNVLGEMDQAVVNLDQFSAVAVAPTSYLIQGQPYKAELFLTAYDSKSNPSISVNGSSIKVENGKGSYSVNTSNEGVHSWIGVIKVKQTDGSVKEYKTAEQKYQVARPSAVVSPKKMNVFYIGVDNPIAVSAPGIPKDKIKVSINGGLITGSNGEYTVRLSKPGTVRVSVTAEVSPGKFQTISSTDFRAKLIPDPRAKFAGKTGGSLSAAVIRGQDYLAVALENFDFDAKFSLQRYTVIVAKPRADAITATGSGSVLSASVKSALSGVTPGTTVLFTDIIATGPDGVQRSLDPLAIRVN